MVSPELQYLASPEGFLFGTTMDFDKTVIIEPGSTAPDYGKCPVCGNRLQPDWENVESVRCSACRYVKKVSILIEPGYVVAHKYRILSYLKGGGNGSIFLCYPLDDPGVRYVLKVLSQPTDTRRKRFRREADILSTVTGNKRIARIIDYWEVGEDTYIVMEYVDGHNLKELAVSSIFDEYSVLQIAHEVIRALQDIWNGYRIIHRDIKPENIMLDKNSRLKLLDFGLSKQFDDSMGGSLITMDSSTLGTPGYMSPEQFTDFKHVDFRSDIYSLGTTLFFLLTGRESSSGSSMMEFYKSAVANSPPAEEYFAGRCSAGCMQMIRKMMQKNPEDRYGSYEELLQDLRILMSNRG